MGVPLRSPLHRRIIEVIDDFGRRGLLPTTVSEILPLVKGLSRSDAHVWVAIRRLEKRGLIPTEAVYRRAVTDQFDRSETAGLIRAEIELEVFEFLAKKARATYRAQKHKLARNRSDQSIW